MTHIIPGRAYTPEQKRTIIERLYAKWLDAPTLRLGQLIFIGTSLRDLFFVEDEAIVATLEECITPATAKPLQAAFDFKEAMISLQQNAGHATEDITAISNIILKLAESEEQL